MLLSRALPVELILLFLTGAERRREVLDRFFNYFDLAGADSCECREHGSDTRGNYPGFSACNASTACSFRPYVAVFRCCPRRVIGPAGIARKNLASGTVCDRVKSNPAPIGRVPSAPPAQTRQTHIRTRCQTLSFQNSGSAGNAMMSSSAPIPIPIRSATPSAIPPAARFCHWALLQ
jgi:hypothetical protein